MAGMPRRNAVATELESRTDLMRKEEPDATVLDYVAAWFQDGRTIDALAADISRYAPTDVSRWTVMRYLNQRFGEDHVEQRLQRARLQGSHAVAEKALALTDGLIRTDGDGNPLIASRDETQAVTLQVRTRQWIAERWNPPAYGDQSKAAHVTVNLNNLHLDALRAANAGVSGYGKPYALKAADQFDAGLGSTRPALGAGHTAPVTVVEPPDHAQHADGNQKSKGSRKAVKRAAQGTRAPTHTRTSH